MYTNTVSSSSQARGRRQRSPFAWLGAGVLGLGVGIGVALTGGTGVAAADSAAADSATAGDTSASASSKSVSAGVGRAARGSGAATGPRLSGSVSSGVSDRSVVASARPSAVVKPASARPAAVVKPASAQVPPLPGSARPVSIPAPTVADGQAQIANSFNDVPKVSASSVASASALQGWLGRFLRTSNPTIPNVQAPTANPSKGAATTRVVARAAASENVNVGTDANFAADVLNSKRPVLVDFTAAWCGPCKRLAPIVDELADGLAGRVTVVKVDIDDAPGLAAQYGIRSVPTILVFSGGVVVKRSFGLTSKANLLALVDPYL
jgi:thioredoxin 1